MQDPPAPAAVIPTAYPSSVDGANWSALPMTGEPAEIVMSTIWLPVPAVSTALGTVTPSTVAACETPPTVNPPAATRRITTQRVNVVGVPRLSGHVACPGCRHVIRARRPVRTSCRFPVGQADADTVHRGS